MQQNLLAWTKEIMSNRKWNRKTDTQMAKWLCQEVTPILLKEPSVLDLQAPIRICGDIHGQFHDLVCAFEAGGMPPQSKYLFLGDYVDRGEKSLEVITVLFALKILYPTSIFLLRGNHESPEMTELFGFFGECTQKLSEPLWPTFCETFNALPIAAIIGGRYFCVHGGLSPNLESIEEIRQIKRPLPISEEGIMADLLWSDPSADVVEWGPNERGATFTWGLAAVNVFLERENLMFIIRGHQMAMDGYNFPFYPDRRVVTIFTASNYAGEYNNKAAFMMIDEEYQSSFSVLSKKIPQNAISTTNNLPSDPSSQSKNMGISINSTGIKRTSKERSTENNRIRPSTARQRSRNPTKAKTKQKLHV